MSDVAHGSLVEQQIAEWRSYLRQRRAIRPVDVDELETHLRDQLTALTDAGLAGDEAFLIAVKRMGSLDAISREFAAEHSGRLWKQLVLTPDGSERAATSRPEAWVALGFAAAAALAMKIPALFGRQFGDDTDLFYPRNLSFFVLPLLTAFFAWKRRLTATQCAWLAVVFVAAGIVANIFPFTRGSDTEVLLVLHLPIALWLPVGIAYLGGRWNRASAMDFVRFSGELFIYYVLIALGGGVIVAFTVMMFGAIGLDAEWLVERWIVPCGAAGAVIVAAWLVEAKQSVIENMAPVLTRLFTPLVTILLIAFLVTMMWTGRPIDIQRQVLIAFDLLLVVVTGLVLYSLSARDPLAPPHPFDWPQLALVVSALAVDALALAAIGGRISEFGFTPNRVAALGENLVLLANLAWSARLYARFLRGTRGALADLERWQTSYLPVYSLWAAVVVILFPLLFGFA
jgi:hypothetical protein